MDNQSVVFHFTLQRKLNLKKKSDPNEAVPGSATGFSPNQTVQMFMGHAARAFSGSVVLEI